MKRWRRNITQKEGKTMRVILYDIIKRV